MKIIKVMAEAVCWLWLVFWAMAGLWAFLCLMGVVAILDGVECGSRDVLMESIRVLKMLWQIM